MSLKKMRLTGVTRAALVGLVLVGVAAAAMSVARRGPAVLAKMTSDGSPAQDIAAPAPKILMVAAAAAPAAKPAGLAAAKTPAVTPASALTPAVAVITLTGCLQHDDGTFRLKDTAGSDAPKARSWKSGFLKKSAGSVEVVDSANRLRLQSHVGQRVSVTGVLLEKEMRARAVQRVGACS